MRQMSTGAVAACRRDEADPATPARGPGGADDPANAALRVSDAAATCCRRNRAPPAAPMDRCTPSDDVPLGFDDEDPLWLREGAAAGLPLPPPPPPPAVCPAIAAATASLISPTDAVARRPGRLKFAALKRYDAGMGETGTVAADAAVDRGRAAVTAPIGGCGALAATCASSHAVTAAKGLGGSGERARCCSGAAAPSPLPWVEIICWAAVLIASTSPAGSPVTSVATAVEAVWMLATGTCCVAGLPAGATKATEAPTANSGVDGLRAGGLSMSRPSAAATASAPTALSREGGNALGPSQSSSAAAADVCLRISDTAQM